MLDLHVDSGLKEYNINGKATVLFNPTDPNFIEKVFSVFNDLDTKHEEYSKAIQEETDGVKIFELARKMDREMRGKIDEALGAEVCGPVFGEISMYAASDGLPLWANLLLAIIDEMDDAFAREKKAANPRIQKYTAKFQRKK